MTELNIQPSEAWLLDIVEINNITKVEKTHENIDTSLMLNFERRSNGAPSKWVRKPQ